MVTTSHIWLLKFKLNYLKNSVPQFHYPHFKYSVVALMVIVLDNRYRTFLSSQNGLLNNADTEYLYYEILHSILQESRRSTDMEGYKCFFCF